MLKRTISFQDRMKRLVTDMRNADRRISLLRKELADYVHYKSDLEKLITEQILSEFAKKPLHYQKELFYLIRISNGNYAVGYSKGEQVMVPLSEVFDDEDTNLEWLINELLGRYKAEVGYFDVVAP